LHAAKISEEHAVSIFITEMTVVMTRMDYISKLPLKGLLKSIGDKSPACPQSQALSFSIIKPLVSTIF
jgi:hypothetical protein